MVITKDRKLCDIKNMNTKSIYREKFKGSRILGSEADKDGSVSIFVFEYDKRRVLTFNIQKQKHHHSCVVG